MIIVIFLHKTYKIPMQSEINMDCLHLITLD